LANIGLFGRQLTATRRAFYESAFVACGLAGLAAYVRALDLAALGADRRFSCAFWDLAAPDRTLDKTAPGAGCLVGLAA